KPKAEAQSKPVEKPVEVQPESGAPSRVAKGAEDPLARPLNLNPTLSDISRWDRDRQRRAREYGVKPREATVNLDNPEPRFTTYFTRLKERIEQGWSYPAAAKREQLSGTLVMRFTIQRSGAITDIRIERPSGEAMLDEAALRAVRQLHPFLPLPEDWDLERLHVQSVFEYIRGGFRMER
ncbi:MAG: TonB family protein, partial [Magnetococcales bacterium]|nr:TonB family protein [Magnetococcales bacterium]